MDRDCTYVPQRQIPLTKNMKIRLSYTLQTVLIPAKVIQQTVFKTAQVGTYSMQT